MSFYSCIALGSTCSLWLWVHALFHPQAQEDGKTSSALLGRGFHMISLVPLLNIP
jgi:hypothetical protein